MKTFKKIGDHYIDLEAIESVTLFPKNTDPSMYVTREHLEVQFASGHKLVLYAEDGYLSFLEAWKSHATIW